MPSTLPQKLKIKENDTLLTLNAPADFKAALKGLPKGASISPTSKDYQQIHWFVKRLLHIIIQAHPRDLLNDLSKKNKIIVAVYILFPGDLALKYSLEHCVHPIVTHIHIRRNMDHVR